MTVLQPSPLLIRATAIGLALSVMVLPVWDGLRSGSVLGIAIGVVLAMVAALVFLRGNLRTRWGTIAAGGALILLYSSVSGGMTILERSRLVNRLPDCDGGTSTETFERTEGPHLKNGTPCVQASEKREAFRKRHPTGELLDGFRQIMLRYPGDLVRLMIGPMIALFFIASSGILFAKAMGPLLTAQREQRP
jgi:hypothetical protein